MKTLQRNIIIILLLGFMIQESIAQGNVGLGTTSPMAKLEVNGQVKITGGNPGAGKVLTSDASGLGTGSLPNGEGVTHPTMIGTESPQVSYSGALTYVRTCKSGFHGIYQTLKILKLSSGRATIPDAKEQITTMDHRIRR